MQLLNKKFETVYTNPLYAAVANVVVNNQSNPLDTHHRVIILGVENTNEAKELITQRYANFFDFANIPKLRKMTYGEKVDFYIKGLRFITTKKGNSVANDLSFEYHPGRTVLPIHLHTVLSSAVQQFNYDILNQESVLNPRKFFIYSGLVNTVGVLERIEGFNVVNLPDLKIKVLYHYNYNSENPLFDDFSGIFLEIYQYNRDVITTYIQTRISVQYYLTWNILEMEIRKYLPEGVDLGELVLTGFTPITNRVGVNATTVDADTLAYYQEIFEKSQAETKSKDNG